MPAWISEYLISACNMLHEAVESTDPKVKLLALRVLERQSSTISELEFEHYQESLLSWRCES